MTSVFRKAWTEVVRPLIRRPERFQVAALCYRGEGPDLRILLITSRDTGRWVLPKGWPMAGRDAAGAAQQEAWEEAGVRPAFVGREAIGHYAYDKRMKGGVPIPCEAWVYPIRVADLAEDFPERAERSRRWVAPEEAAQMVHEPDLQELLRDVAPRLSRQSRQSPQAPHTPQARGA